MTKLTSDGELVVAGLAVAALLYILYVVRTARKNNGVVELHPAVISFLLFGFGGVTISPTLMLISNDHKKKQALIAHERCHQMQMLRDGYWTWVFRYAFNLAWRQEYEIEAYRVWVKHEPNDAYVCASWLVNDYGLSLSQHEAMQLLTQS